LAVPLQARLLPLVAAVQLPNFLTSRTLSGRRISLSGATMVGLTDDKSPSSPCVLTKIFRITNAKHEDRSSCCQHPAGRANSSTAFLWTLGRPSFLGNAPALIDQVGAAAQFRRVLFTRFRSSDIFRQLGCGCNCGCTLPHIANVSSIYGCSSVRALDL
jgi:hypothetical protein